MARNRNPDLHGAAPDKSHAALLLIDVINALDFPEGKQLLRQAVPMARRLAALKKKAAEANVPVIYANDNFGRWRSDFQAQVRHCLQVKSLGRSIVRLLKPDPDDYFVLKPKHSGFFSTTLGTLLEYLQVKTLVIGGLAANICVLFTASDAFMRDLELFVPADCVASNTLPETKYALGQMEQVLKADIGPSTTLRFFPNRVIHVTSSNRQRRRA